MSTLRERPRGLRRRSLLPMVIMLAVVLASGMAYAGWRLIQPAPEPDVVAGLRTVPSLTWSYQLQEGMPVSPMPVGDDSALVIPDGRIESGTAPVSMIKLTDSQEVWRIDVQVAPGSRLTGGEVSGTDRVYVLESRPGAGILTSRKASDGSAAASRELPAGTTVTADGGMLFLLDGARLTRVDPQTLGTLWEVRTANSVIEVNDTRVIVRDGYALVTNGSAGTRFLGVVLSAHAVIDGTAPAWQPAGTGDTLIVGDQVVRGTLGQGNRLLGVTRTGEVTWQSAPFIGFGLVAGETLLKWELAPGASGQQWTRIDPVDGTDRWKTPFRGTDDQSMIEMQGRLVVVAPRTPLLVAVDSDSGRETARFPGDGFQTVWFAGEGGRIFSASALDSRGRAEDGGSLTSPNGVRLRAIDLDAREPEWVTEFSDPLRIVQCGSRLLAINLITGRIRGIA